MNAWLGSPELVGTHITLRPLYLDDAKALGAIVDDPIPFKWSAVPIGTQAAHAYIADALGNPARVAFAVMENSTGELIGSTSFYDIDKANRSLAVGYTFYTVRSQGTLVNPEAKFLLLQHAFENARAVRVVWHTDQRNARSRAAIAKLGATFEGVLRKHRPATDGGLRTTAQYAMVDDDWPEVRTRLLERIR